MRIRTYTELRRFETFEDRYEYLRLGGEVGQTTFGFDRWLNQQLYSSHQWRRARDQVIVRDEGCDLGVPGFELEIGLLVHHMNPLTPEAIENGEEWIFDPEFLIVTSKRTHNAIHFGDRSLLPRAPVERRPGDTTLW